MEEPTRTFPWKIRITKRMLAMVAPSEHAFAEALKKLLEVKPPAEAEGISKGLRSPRLRVRLPLVCLPRSSTEEHPSDTRKARPEVYL